MRATLARRDANRRALHDRLGFAVDGVPLATVVTRLTHQKGIDLLVPLVALLEQIPMRLAILGSGDAGLAAHLHHLAGEYPNSFAFVEGYDESLSHLMFAGADAYLMPSRFEPCGLTQMQAMRYGAIPIVTAVGGLVDTVLDADLDRKGHRIRRRSRCVGGPVGRDVPSGSPSSRWPPAPGAAAAGHEHRLVVEVARQVNIPRSMPNWRDDPDDDVYVGD